MHLKSNPHQRLALHLAMPDPEIKTFLTSLSLDNGLDSDQPATYKVDDYGVSIVPDEAGLPRVLCSESDRAPNVSGAVLRLAKPPDINTQLVVQADAFVLAVPSSHREARLPPVKYPTTRPPQLSTRAGKLAEMIAGRTVVFRVFDDNSEAPLTEHGFVASHFAKDRDSIDVQSILSSLTNTDHSHITNHISRRPEDILDSEWVSTTPVLLWALMEAVKRVREGKTGVGLAVIDIRNIKWSPLHQRKIYYGFELTTDPHARRLTNNPQEILIHGIIPQKCIVSLTPFSEVLEALPSFFFTRDFLETNQFSSSRTVDDLAFTTRRLYPKFRRSWYGDAVRSLMRRGSSFDVHCKNCSVLEHAKAAYSLAYAFIRPLWMQTLLFFSSSEHSTISCSEGRDHLLRLCPGFERANLGFVGTLDIQGVSYVGFTSHTTQIGGAIHSEAYLHSAIRYVTSILRVIAGNIASLGIRWSEDVDDQAWNLIAREIEELIRKQLMDDLRSLNLDRDNFITQRLWLFTTDELQGSLRRN